jgi:hypothetical protein
MCVYPIASYSFIADARRVPVSNTIVVTPTSCASRSRASTSARPMPRPRTDGSTYIRFDFGGRLVQPPHRGAAYRHVIDIGDQERAAAGQYLRVAEREVGDTRFRKRLLQFRIQCRDQLGRVGRGQRAATNVNVPHASNLSTGGRPSPEYAGPG